MSGKVIKVLSNIRFIRHKQGAAPPEKSALPPVATSETRNHASEAYVQRAPSGPSNRRARHAPSTADMAEARALAQWLQDADLPRSFALYPWVFVQESAVFRSSLIADLCPAQPHARFRPALEEARRVRALFP
jgi:hypothetical protein